MKFKSVFLASMLASVIAAAPASAVVYDAFTSFNGINGNAPGGTAFIYGEANPATPGTSGTFFSANTNCFIDNSICLQAAADHDVPGFTKGGSPAVQYNGSVNVPNDRLLGHPDDDSDLTFIAFVAPTAGTYLLNAVFNLQDNTPSGIDISLIRTTNAGLPLIFTPVSSLLTVGDTYTYTQSVTLLASEAIGFGVGNRGSYNNDSFGVNFSATVPEPATWAMMIGGFGLVGGALRRRRHQPSVSFA